MALDVVVAHRGDEIGLWMTTSSLLMSNELDEIPYKVHIVSNGAEKVGQDLQMTLDGLEKAGHLGSFEHFSEPLSPPSARNRGAAKGTGETILFLDNHVMLEDGFVSRGLEHMSEYGMDALHSVTRYWADGIKSYHYRFTLERNFWGYQVKEPHAEIPYQIAGGGHGAFFVRRAVWGKVGGYWDGFKGYGGEESYFELKLAMMDFNNWLDPTLVHWHHPGKRPYIRDKGDDFVKNMLCAANIIGGDSWAKRVLNGFKIGQSRGWFLPKVDGPAERMKDLDSFFVEAKERSQEHADSFQRNAYRTLNEQLVKFSRQGVAL
jgi:hypothetical protein